MPRQVDIEDFARRVERLCDFIINKAERDGSKDIVVIQELKDDAADILTNKNLVATEMITGLSDFMKGATDHEVRPRGDQ